MTSGDETDDRGSTRSTARPEVVVSVDAMGGDHGAETVLDGLDRALAEDPRLNFLLHGEQAALSAALKDRAALAHASEVVICDSVVPMDARPTEAVRSGRRSSMGLALDAVAAGRAHAALSAGNTGALMAMATLRLRPADSMSRPAIAALWPSRNPAGYNVVLDVGADLRADADALVAYAVMGAEYARIALGVDRPRAALLNVGVEEAKGPPELRLAAERLASVAEGAGFDFAGYVEGDRIASRDVDVVVTDGFSGNIALKSAEGAARLVGDYLREALGGSLIGRAAALLAQRPLAAFKRRMDPRRVNGGVFLGLSGVVVKSHGGADGLAIATATALAARMGRARIAERIAQQVASLGASGDDAAGANRGVAPSDAPMARSGGGAGTGDGAERLPQDGPPKGVATGSA